MIFFLHLFVGLSVATILKAIQPVKSNKHIVHLSTLKGSDEDEEVLHIAIEDPERKGVFNCMHSNIIFISLHSIVLLPRV